MKDSIDITYLGRMGVPNNGIPIYSDLEFENQEAAERMLETAYSDGVISGWTVFKVTKTARYERLNGEGEEG